MMSMSAISVMRNCKSARSPFEVLSNLIKVVGQ